jgi:hypothetical protein
LEKGVRVLANNSPLEYHLDPCERLKEWPVRQLSHHEGDSLEAKIRRKEISA